MFKKRKKWFEVQGILLGVEWVKQLTSITPLFNSSVSGDITPWRFRSYAVKESCEITFAFSTEKEAEYAHKSLVNWIKEVQS